MSTNQTAAAELLLTEELAELKEMVAMGQEEPAYRQSSRIRGAIRMARQLGALTADEAEAWRLVAREALPK